MCVEIVCVCGWHTTSTVTLGSCWLLPTRVKKCLCSCSFFFTPVNLQWNNSYLDADLCTQLIIYWTTSSLTLTRFETKRFAAVISFPWVTHQSSDGSLCFKLSWTLLRLPDLNFLGSNKFSNPVPQWPFAEERGMESIISNSFAPPCQPNLTIHFCVATKPNASQGSSRLTALILLAYWSLVWSGGESYLRESVLQTATVCSRVLALESCVFRGLNCSRSRWNRPPSVVFAPKVAAGVD